MCVSHGQEDLVSEDTIDFSHLKVEPVVQSTVANLATAKPAYSDGTRANMLLAANGRFSLE